MNTIQKLTLTSILLLTQLSTAYGNEIETTVNSCLDKKIPEISSEFQSKTSKFNQTQQNGLETANSWLQNNSQETTNSLIKFAQNNYNASFVNDLIDLVKNREQTTQLYNETVTSCLKQFTMDQYKAQFSKDEFKAFKGRSFLKKGEFIEPSIDSVNAGVLLGFFINYNENAIQEQGKQIPTRDTISRTIHKSKYSSRKVEEINKLDERQLGELMTRKPIMYIK